MTYTEEIYERSEIKFTSLAKQLEWLNGFAERNGNDYEKAGLVAADDLRKLIEIRDNINTAKELERYETMVQTMTVVKLKKEAQSEIDTRKKYLDSNIEKLNKETIKEYKSKIKDAKTPGEVSAILSRVDVGTTPQKVRNILKQEALDKNAELRSKAAKEREAKQKEDSEKLAEEKAKAKTEEKDRILKEKLEEKAKALQTTLEGQARAKQRYDERKLAEQIATAQERAKDQAREDELAQAIIERRKELEDRRING